MFLFGEEQCKGVEDQRTSIWPTYLSNPLRNPLIGEERLMVFVEIDKIDKKIQLVSREASLT